MKKQACWHRIMRHLAVALTLVALLVMMSPSPASAQDLSESFQASWDPITLDKKEIQGSEVFHIAIKGQISCIKDMPVPLPISEATLTSRVIALDAANDTRVTLNSSYIITVKPFPSRKDQTAKINHSIPLQFPAQAEEGDYDVILEIVEARVKAVISFDVTSQLTNYLPRDQSIGTVKYTTPKSTLAPPASPPAPAPTSPPAPAPTSAPAPAPTPAPPVAIIPWWVWLIVIVAVATTFFNIGWFLGHRRRNPGTG